MKLQGDNQFMNKSDRAIESIQNLIENATTGLSPEDERTVLEEISERVQARLQELSETPAEAV